MSEGDSESIKSELGKPTSLFAFLGPGNGKYLSFCYSSGSILSGLIILRKETLLKLIVSANFYVLAAIIYFKYSNFGTQQFFFNFSIVLFVGALCNFLALFFKVNFIEGLLIFLSSVTRAIWSSHLEYWSLANDYKGHIDYIGLILKGQLWPASNSCWQCYHPPFYYWIVAFIKNFMGGPFGLEQIAIAVAFILSVWLSFLILSFLRLARLPKTSHYLLLILFLVWPSFFIKSHAAGNDSLAYVFWMLFCIFLVNGQKYKNVLLISLPALMTKVTALLPLISFGLFRLFQKIPRIFFAGSFFALVIWRWVVEQLSMEERKSLARILIKNLDGFDQRAILKNTFWNVFGVDFQSLFMEPFIAFSQVSSGKDFFSALFIKTALFGEFTFNINSKVLWSARILIAVMLIWLIIYFFLLFAKILKSEDALFSFLFFVPFCVSMGMRILMPYTFVGDSRYILPALIPLLIFLSLSLRFHRWAHRIFISSCAVFIISSVVFLSSI